MASVGTLAGCEFMEAINPHAGSHKIITSWCWDRNPPCGILLHYWPDAWYAVVVVVVVQRQKKKKPTRKPEALAFAKGKIVHMMETFKRALCCVHWVS